MNEALESLKKTIIELIKKVENENWVNTEVLFNFPPFINRAYNATYHFKGAEGEILSNYLPFSLDFQNMLLNFVYLYNQEDKYNQISVFTKKDDYKNATISISFNQEVEDDFRNNLPKSWRKKAILPWWQNPEETKGLG
jgi:hypothetical protein